MSSPEIIIIVAMAQNRVIGKNGTIPWHIPEDLKHFKAMTLNHAVIMGRKTWDSIARPLPKRTNIIVSRKNISTPKDSKTVPSLNLAIQYAAARHNKIFIIGGGEIYIEALPLADTIHITLLNRSVSGTVFFPNLPQNRFILQNEEQYQWAEPVTLQHFSRRSQKV